MDRWKAPALQRELLDHVWAEAQRRALDVAADPRPELRRRQEIDRTLRAHVHVAWSRHGFRIALTALWLATLLGWLPLGYTYVTDVAVLVGIAVVMTLAVGQLVKRWYRRGQRLWRSRA
ncbi:MAG TPA: hypothetical protein VFS37_00190 [Conexibacter sp.]|nr:hypothetical protein [Conexibacter sp.]